METKIETDELKIETVKKSIIISEKRLRKAEKEAIENELPVVQFAVINFSCSLKYMVDALGKTQGSGGFRSELKNTIMAKVNAQTDKILDNLPD
jgi:hypothetical protein